MMSLADVERILVGLAVARWSHTGFMPTFAQSLIMMSLYLPDLADALTTLKSYLAAFTPFLAPSDATNGAPSYVPHMNDLYLEPGCCHE